jgi:hypothetical protein
MRPASLAPRQWTPLDDERLRSLAVAGMAAWEIAVDLERTVAAVRSRTERFGISLKRVKVARRAAWSRFGLKAKK